MAPTVETIIGVLVFLLGLLSVWGAAIGIETWLRGESVERCPRCHRLGMTVRGVRHPAGCPAHRWTTVEHALGRVRHHHVPPH